MDDEDTARLRAVQEQRASEEAGQATQEHDLEAVRAHERRADKAAYLAEKLAERERSEDEAEG